MVPGMIFTIEPMVNMGKVDIYVDDANDWEVYTEDGLPSAQWEIMVLGDGGRPRGSLLVSRRQDEKAGKKGKSSASMKKAGHRAAGKAASMKKAGTERWEKQRFWRTRPRRRKGRCAGRMALSCNRRPWACGRLQTCWKEPVRWKSGRKQAYLRLCTSGEASMDMEEGKIHPRDQVTAGICRGT